MLPQSHYEFGQVLYLLELPQEALRELQIAELLGHCPPDSLLISARCYQRTEQPALAISLANHFACQQPLRIAELEEVLAHA